MTKIDFIFSEFHSKFKPNKANIFQYFPEARILEYNEHNTELIFSGDRRLYHMGDYQDWVGLLNSKADVAIAFDADLHIVSDQVKAIMPLVNKFGFCVAASGRYTVKRDTVIGTDSDRVLDDSLGTGYAMCNAFIAVNPKDARVREVFEVAVKLMSEEPLRGPLVLWRAIWKTGIFPYMLPQQWCVCQDLLDLEDPIILHCGDKLIREHYVIPAS